MLWKQVGSKCFHSFFEFSQTFMSVSVYNLTEIWRTCFLFLLENTKMKKGKSTCLLWSSKCKILIPGTIDKTTACASSVFLSSYRNMVPNQSACAFAVDYFLNVYAWHPYIKNISHVQTLYKHLVNVLFFVLFLFFSNTIIKSYQVLTTISLEIKMTVPVTKIYTLDVKSTFIYSRSG